MAEHIPPTGPATSETHPVHTTVHHEERDINVRLVLVGTAIFVVLTIIMLVGLWGMYIGFRAIDRRLDPKSVTAIPSDSNEVSLMEPGDPNVPEFILHWSIGTEKLDEFREAENEVLESWGWIDETSGQVRMPIDEAMGLALERGFPVREPGAGGGELEVRPSWIDEESRAGETEPGREPVDEQDVEETAPDGDEPASEGGHR